MRVHEHPIAVSFEILKNLGDIGKTVWRHGKTLEDENERLAYLKNSIAWLRTKVQEGHKGMWRRLPADFRTFVESKELLNKRSALWPRVIEEGSEINSGKYTEVVLTGGIGVAKTTLALYTQAYQVYVLSCLADPHSTFDLDSSSEILIVFQSINKSLAQDVDYKRFRDMIQHGPYFQKFYMFNTTRETDMRFPRNVIVKPVAGHDTAAIGQNVIGGIIDEVNFMAVVADSKNSKDGGTYDQATQNYNSIARRRESRFMQLGTLPGMLCLVSSRNYPGQFTDKKEAEAKTNPHIYIYDKRLWDIRPERFCGETFRVFQGDETRKPRLLLEEEIVKESDEALVIMVPVEYRKSFESDLIPALRDIAGVATPALHPFMMNTEAIIAAFGVRSSVASREDCDFKESHVNLDRRQIINPLEPRLCHIDLAISKDSAGVAIGHIAGFKEMDRGDYAEMMPVISYDMILEVKPPRGGEIEIENIRRLLYTLRDRMDMRLKWVSFDQFQSRDSMQILYQQGFIVGYQSMDADTRAYDCLKQGLYDYRIQAPHHPKAQKEITTLEIDVKKGKVDHPPNGSKDVSDAVAGVALGLTLRRELWARHNVPANKRPRFLTEANNKNSLTNKEGERRHG